MKKNKLDFDYEFEFDLTGIVCNHKEYKLAWYLNSSLDIELVKQPDIKMEFSNQVPILISNSKFESKFVDTRLLQNRLARGKLQFLMPEVKQFDYLLRLRDQTGEMTIENVCTIIRAIPLVEYISQLNFDDLKSKGNLLY